MRRENLPGYVKTILYILSGLGIAISVYCIFSFHFMGKTILDIAYRAILLAIFLPPTFFLFKFRKSSPSDRIPWYDILLAVLSVAGPLFVFVYANEVMTLPWAIEPPVIVMILGILTWVLLLEATRRYAGLPLTILIGIFSVYPLFANYMPSILLGKAYSIERLVGFHFLSDSSILGLPMATLGSLILGFLIFGAMLLVTGGGSFFIDLANSLMGHVRGGAAKVCIVASAFFGTMSGVAVSSVASVGVVTIPTMKRAGYPSHFAAAVEACASTGGTLMPPVMGVTAFMMANFLQIPYIEVVKAAVIPAILYYFSLFMQMDFFAAKNKLTGIPRNELPSLSATLKKGWPYLFALAILIFFLLYQQMETTAPYYASAFLLTYALIRKESRLSLRPITQLLEETGKMLVELTPIMASVGMLMGALTLTGAVHSFASELTKLVGNNLPLLLIGGALTSIVMGMGLPVVPCYMFLALLVGPALINLGILPIAAHLYFLYWGMLSFLTPPVCLAVYAACGIAGSPFWQTGWQAVRLAIVAFIVPFFFVIDPALIAQGPVAQIILSFCTSILGVVLFSAGLEGHMIKLGTCSWPIRILLFVSGILLFYPSWQADIAGVVIVVIIFVFKRLQPHLSSIFLRQRK